MSPNSRYTTTLALIGAAAVASIAAVQLFRKAKQEVYVHCRIVFVISLLNDLVETD
jgi:hypothetical protein